MKNVARFRRHIPMVVAIVLSATLAASAPSIAAAVQKALFAENTDKVDGIHAREYTTNAGQRENKLIGANNKGFLPNNIIKKAPDAAKLKGAKASRYLDHGQRTLVVDKGGKGDFKTIQAAVDKAQTLATENQRYRVLVLPGTYEEHVTLHENIDLEGVGLRPPEITCACGQATNMLIGAATLNVFGGTVRNLSVENTGSGSYAQAISSNAAGTKLVDVKAEVGGADTFNTAVWSLGGDIELTRVEARGSGGNIAYGLRVFTGDARATDSTFTGGSANLGLSPENRAVSLEDPAGDYVLRGIAVHTNGADSSVPNLAIYNRGLLELRDSEVRSLATGSENYGLINQDASAVISNTRIQVGNATTSYGVFNHTGSSDTVDIERSTIIVSNAGNTVRNVSSGYTTRIAMSRLNGTATANVGGSTLTCAGVYDENYVFSASTCP